MNSRAGFSLVEVLCAVLILGIGLTGLTEALTLALSSNKQAEIQSAAVLLAAGQIESLRADGFLAAGESEGEGEGDLSAYTWKQSVVETRTEGLFEVTVTIDRNSEPVYELVTLLFDPPMTREEQKKDSRDRERQRQRRRG